MKRSIAQRVTNFLLEFVHTQLFITLISMPVLIHWGLPISIMTFVGNLVFTPVLTGIIVLGSLMFFTELAGIPNSFFVTVFDCISSWWCLILGFNSPKWLIAQAHPGWITLALIPLVGIVGLWHPKLRPINATRTSRILFMLCVLAGSFILLALQAWLIKPATIPSLHEALTITRTGTGINVIDNGYFNTKSNAENMLRFTLKPHLAKYFGTTSITHLILNKPGYRSFVAAKHLVPLFQVQQVTIAYFDTLEKNAWREFFILKKILTTHNIELHRVALDSSSRAKRSSKRPTREPQQPR